MLPNFLYILISFLVGVLLHFIILKTYKFGIKNFENKIIKEDYVVSFSEFILILVVLVFAINLANGFKSFFLIFGEAQ